MELDIVKAFDTPIASLHLIHFDSEVPYERAIEAHSDYRVNMYITPCPPNSRGRYHNHWSSQQFKALGPLFMLPPSEPLHFRSEAGSMKSILCELRQDAVSEWLDSKFRWSARRLEFTLNMPSERIRWLLLQAVQELRHPGFGHAAAIELITAQMALELARFSVGSPRSPGAGLSTARLRLIDERLAEPSAAPTIAELAELCRMSSRQLVRSFQVSRGCSLGAYIARQRIAFAENLLRQGDSIKVIADVLGFCSPSSFTYAFRRATGLTPRQFREHHAV